MEMPKLRWWDGQGPCPEARMLVAEVELDLVPDELKALAARVRAGLTDSSPSEQIAAAVELRKAIAARYAIDRLRPLVASLRVRHDIATGRAVDIPGLKAVEEMTTDQLLGEAESLLERLKTIYTLSSMRDAKVADFRFRSLWALALLLLALLATKLPFLFDREYVDGVNQALNLFSIALIGAVGSVVSIMRRSQKALDLGPIDIDPVRQISALRHGFSGMLIAAMVGPVLALALFGVFAGHMLTIAGLTPEFAACTDTCSFVFLDHGFDFRSAGDAAKMAIWAFLAGFAEQLVPDVLDKFGRAAKEAPAGRT